MSSSSSTSPVVIPPTCQAAVVRKANAPFEFVNVPTPTITDENPLDLLVQVKSVSVNPVDYKVKKGYVGSIDEKDPVGKIIGYDAAGVVVAVGKESGKHFKVGDSVWYSGVFSKQGSNTEYQLIDHRMVGISPSSWTSDQIAAFPLVAMTAFESITEYLLPSLSLANPSHPQHGNHHHLSDAHKESVAGKSVLIIGGAGGVGSAAIQLAKLFGLKVIATASRPESKLWVKKMGADIVIDHSQSDAYTKQLKDAGVDSVNFVINTISEKLIPDFINAVAPRGHIVGMNGDMSEESTKALNSTGFFKRITFSFELMFSRPFLGYEIEVQGRILAHLAKLVDQKLLQPIDTQIMSWKDLEKAHQLVETKHNIGKIVLKVQN